jgi:hypothetical protein
MLCRVSLVLASENDTAGFELPFHAVDLKPRIFIRCVCHFATSASGSLEFYAPAKMNFVTRPVHRSAFAPITKSPRELRFLPRKVAPDCLRVLDANFNFIHKSCQPFV